ncbi:hypothetical protein E2C01_034328 [Portunus trituberculatus]|uniref:Uncharacterized protein n=1 Tax=Portunus trituberculatus TaxID=210409 RepID=A0A5B7F1C0_PORTR|nr:hypothetical protein [Portunus trituberculatus]
MQRKQLVRINKEELIDAILSSNEDPPGLAEITNKLSDVMAELASLKDLVTSPDISTNKRLTALETRLEQQEQVIAKQQQFIESLDRKEREANLVILGVPDEREALDGAVTDGDKLNKQSGLPSDHAPITLTITCTGVSLDKLITCLKGQRRWETTYTHIWIDPLLRVDSPPLRTLKRLGCGMVMLSTIIAMYRLTESIVGCLVVTSTVRLFPLRGPVPGCIMAGHQEVQEGLSSPSPSYGDGEFVRSGDCSVGSGQDSTRHATGSPLGSSSPFSSASHVVRRVCASSGCRRVLGNAHNDPYSVCIGCRDGLCDVNNRCRECAEWSPRRTPGEVLTGM